MTSQLSIYVLPELTFENTASKEEVYFFWYLKQLYENGFIDEIHYQPETMELFPAETLKFKVQGATKPLTRQVSILLNKEYTPDFKIKWNKKAKGIFYINIDELDYIVFTESIKKVPFYTRWLGNVYPRNEYCYVDVKGTFSSHGQKSDMIFSLIQKILYDHHKFHMYINKTIPSKLFEKTFTPDRYLHQDKANGIRKIKFPIHTYQDFITNTQSIIHSIHDDTDYKNSSGEQPKPTGEVLHHPPDTLPSTRRRPRKEKDYGPDMFSSII